MNLRSSVFRGVRLAAAGAWGRSNYAQNDPRLIDSKRCISSIPLTRRLVLIMNEVLSIPHQCLTPSKCISISLGVNYETFSDFTECISHLYSLIYFA